MPLIYEHDPIRALMAAPAPWAGRQGPAAAAAAPARRDPRREQRHPAALRPLDAVLTGRRSVRSFSDEPVSLDDFAFVLETAYTADRENFRAVPETAAAPLVLVAASALEDTPPGIHRYRPPVVPSSVTLDPLPAPASMVGDLRSAYCAAPIIMLICADPTAADPGHPASSYRKALVRAGALGYAAWLAARSVGLDASVYGAGCREVTRLLRGEAGRPERHLFTLALGRRHSERPAATA